jgi:hypothetical protein
VSNEYSGKPFKIYFTRVKKELRLTFLEDEIGGTISRDD